MEHNQIFSEIGFGKDSFKSFIQIRDFVESAEGCNAYVYKPPKMKEARAAHIPPGEVGKRAVQVFARIKPNRAGITILRPRRFSKGKAESECRVNVAPDGSGWAEAKSALLQWRLDPISPK